MPILEAVRLALQQIRVQKLKSFFTLLGVIIGVTFLIAVVSIVNGMGRYMEEDFAGRLLGVNTFTLRPFPWFSSGNVTEEEWRSWQRRPKLYLSDIPGIVEVLPTGSRWAVESQNNVTATSPFARPRQIEGHSVEGDYFAIKKYDLSSGRVFSEQEAVLGAKVVVIGDEVAQHFFPNLDPIGRELRIGGVPYQVIGVMEKQGTLFGLSLDRIALAPVRSPLHRLTNPRGDLDGLLVQGATPLAMEEAMESVREYMRGRHKLRPVEPDDFVMETSETALSFLVKIRQYTTMAAVVLPGIGLVVGAMVIMNIMLVAVAERTREIGVRKSLGARRRDIMAQFLVESATLSTLGALLGIVLGVALTALIAWKTPLPAAVAPWSVAVATIVGMVVGIVAGSYPASRAARLDPIVALRSE
jgi:putative ABC transport system permease protein